ncbi:MAG: hypothetical protein H5T90_09400 [Acetomicrobium sp.]|nr:hypothetical protein [Acetomicrobium sp.]
MDRVLGLNVSGYMTTIKAYNDADPALYLGVAPQVNVEYDLISEKSSLKVLCTFIDGKLQFLHMFDYKGAPLLDEMALTSANVVAKAKAFLDNHRIFTENQLYGGLAKMLDEVAVGNNFTKTSGNVKLEVTFASSYTTFKWIYAFNGVVAPSKFVAIGFKNGYLIAFVDNWQVHEVGSLLINLSEKEAIDIALDAALKHSWSIPLKEETLRNLKVSWAELIFDHSVGADNPRGENLLQLFPVWRVGISLDKWYGNIYGIEIDIWADTKQIRRISEAWSTLPAPEGAPTANLSVLAVSPILMPETADHEKMFRQATNICYAKPDTTLSWMAAPAICIVALGIMPLMAKGKGKRRCIKIVGILMCLSILVVTFIQNTPIKALQTRAAVVWGSESIGAYDPNLGFSWRKHPTEITCQRYISSTIANFFGSNGYTAYNRQGYPGSLKSNILSTLSSLQSSFDRVAVIVFDHGVGSTSYSQAPGEFHFMFEDNIGTKIGSYPGTDQPDNGVYDMDIYPRTVSGKIVFALINTCMSARLTNPITGENWQGLVNGRARGLPFAFTRRIVLPRNHPLFNVVYHISADGYSQPDSGSQCYIGFPWGSASLMQRIPYNTGMEYVHWVYYFFYYALSYDMSVNQALDHASWQCWGQYFGNCPLRTGFTAVWPFYYNGQWNNHYGDGSTMAVYGNGNISLRP